MSKILEIKAAQLVARKAKNTTTASLLTTVIGEAEMIGKSAGNRESTDAEVLAVLKKFEKNMLETIGYLTSGQSTSDFLVDKINIVEAELEIIRQFLPTKLTDLQVQKDIGSIMTERNLVNEPKSLGIITKELKVKYGEQFDGQQISTQFKGMSV